MFKNKKSSQFIFWRNCLLTYLFAGFCAVAIADIHKSFHFERISEQASNSYRLISIDR